MAKLRMINTRFWIDDYISNLDPIEKLLFLYFLTNPYTDICGVYEIPLKHISLETGLEKEMVEKILKRFEESGKIYYEKGWVAIANFSKHQLDNPKVSRGIQLGLAKAPESLVNKVKNSLSVDYDRLSHSNLNSNSNPNKENAGFSERDLRDLIDLFKVVSPNSYKSYFGNTTERKAGIKLLEIYPLEDYQRLVGDILPRLNTMAYVGKDSKAFKPSELLRNIDKIIAKIKEEKIKVVEKKNKVAIIT